jgi:hypothetical protein
MKINYQKIICLTLTFTALVLNLSLVQTSQADVFAITGSLNVASYGAMATLLPNGEVLVAGGYNDSGAPLSSAELYGPTNETWTLTGSLNTARYGATATLLPNGEVLVAGGVGPLSSAELYNPTTGTWTSTGALNVARWGATATLLPNGEVLVAGGYHYGIGYLSSAELYNPATGTWTLTGALNNARGEATATLLANGEVLVAGGYNGSNALSSAELYSPATGTWTLTSSLINACYEATATLLPNGQVLVAGGENSSGTPLSNSELYNYVPASTTAPVTPSGLTATAGDGQVVLAWDAPGQATGYNVASSTSFSGPYTIIATNLNTLIFTNSGLADGTTYYFVVSAVNAAGVSSNSVPVSALPISTAAPFFNIAASGGQIQLIWPRANTGWSLQVQTNALNTGIGTNWVTMPGSMLTNQMYFQVNPANESVFFRLAYPQN